MKHSILRYTGSWSAIIGPILFTALVALESLLRPGFSQITNFVSDLGIGKYSDIQNVNFIIFGTLSIIFALGLRVTLPENKLSAKSAVWATVIFGVGIIFAGITLILTGSSSVSSSDDRSHVISSVVAFLSIISAQFLTWRALRYMENTAWDSYRKYTLISGFMSLLTLSLFAVTQTAAYGGATERIFLAVPWAWVEVSGIMLQLSVKREATRSKAKTG